MFRRCVGVAGAPKPSGPSSLAATTAGRPKADPGAASTADLPEWSPLPETWDNNIAGLRGVVARLAASGHRQLAAIMAQQLQVALVAAAVPVSKHQIYEAAIR